MCDILVLYLLARKITTCIIAHRPIRLASRCVIFYFYLLARKITTCIIAHRPFRLASRCAISGCNMHHRTSTDSIRSERRRRGVKGLGVIPPFARPPSHTTILEYGTAGTGVSICPSRRQLVPFFSTISILDESPKALTWIGG